MLSYMFARKVCKIFCQNLVDKKASISLKSQGKWLAEGDVFGKSTVTVNWKNTLHLPFLCTIETKLRVLYFNLLHRRIAANDFLCKMGIRQEDPCSFCKETTETLVHLFLEM